MEPNEGMLVLPAWHQPLAIVVDFAHSAGLDAGRTWVLVDLVAEMWYGPFASRDAARAEAEARGYRVLRPVASE